MRDDTRTSLRRIRMRMKWDAQTTSSLGHGGRGEGLSVTSVGVALMAGNAEASGSIVNSHNGNLGHKEWS